MLAFILAICIPALTTAGKWQSTYTGAYFEACYRGQFINGIKSIYSSQHKDRRWTVTCGSHPDYKVDNHECQWSGWINKVDHTFKYQCPSGSVVAGMQSYFVPGHGDRRYQVRCCPLTRKRPECSNGRWGAACQFACACPGQALCSKEDGSCPGHCPPGKWGFRCLFDDHCYYDPNLSTYAGRLNTTKDGLACQAWSSQEPHKHKYRLAGFFTDQSTLPDNYCRASVTTKTQQPWCFTTDPKTRWQPCKIQKCDCPHGTWGPACDRECHCQGDIKSCDREGRCASGCAPGWTGETCMVKQEPSFSSCKLSKYVNDWGKPMNAGLKEGSFFTGLFAAFDVRQDDRRWRFVTCQV